MKAAEALADLRAVFAKDEMKSYVKVARIAKKEVGFVTEILTKANIGCARFGEQAHCGGEIGARLAMNSAKPAQCR